MNDLTIINLRQIPVDQMVEIWLDNKTRISNSQSTRRGYSDNIRWFREHLQARGLDLDCGDSFTIALEAQKWAGHDNPKPSSYNSRLSAIRSFYTYAKQVRLLQCENPKDFLERARADSYANTKALNFAEVKRRLAAIDRTTVLGKRDYAFLSVAFHTGRRRAELLGLRMGDIEFGQEAITLNFRHCKGGKVMSDTLSPILSSVLRDYFQALYGAAYEQMPPDAAIWVPCDRARKARKPYKPMSKTATYHIVQRRLGISGVHRVRHTFARGMAEVGAKVTDIQERLGHSSLKTTSLYLAALRSSENPHGEQLDSLFGIEERYIDRTEQQADAQNDDVFEDANCTCSDQRGDATEGIEVIAPHTLERDGQQNAGNVSAHVQATKKAGKRATQIDGQLTFWDL